MENERHGWVYFEIFRGWYGLPQSGKLANNLLRTKLEDAQYYETATTPGLWRHKWRSIQFLLVVDNFGIEYVRKQDADHLTSVLKKHHEISQDWEGKKFAGIDLDWNYATKHWDRTYRLSMKNYIKILLVKLNPPMPRKPQLSPHKWREVKYGSKTQIAPEEYISKPLNDAGIRQVQKIVGALLWIGRAVNNKLYVALSTIGSQQASATEDTNKAIRQILDYCATYPDDGISYQYSDMVLAGYSDDGFNNETRSRSRAGAHFFFWKLIHPSLEWTSSNNFSNNEICCVLRCRSWNGWLIFNGKVDGATSSHANRNGLETATFTAPVRKFYYCWYDQLYINYMQVEIVGLTPQLVTLQRGSGSVPYLLG